MLEYKKWLILLKKQIQESKKSKTKKMNKEERQKKLDKERKVREKEE